MAVQRFKQTNGSGMSPILNPVGAAPTTVDDGNGGQAVYSPFHGAATGTTPVDRSAARSPLAAHATTYSPRSPLSDPANLMATKGQNDFGQTPGSNFKNLNKVKGEPPGGAAPPAAPAPGPGGGSESGPGILESWFNSRAGGTDPGYEYAVGRGVKGINDQFAARGGYNSGAAIQAIGDYQANMGSQRESQLDALAGGASGEHQGRLNSMFSQGLGIANGQGGISGMYDIGAGNAISSGNKQAIQLALDRAGVDSKTAQGILSAIFSAGGLLS